MNAEEIRAEAIDRIARCMDYYVAEAAVDALGDLLPTDTEEGQNIIRDFVGEVVQRGPIERRYVTEFKPVTE